MIYNQIIVEHDVKNMNVQCSKNAKKFKANNESNEEDACGGAHARTQYIHAAKELDRKIERASDAMNEMID